LNSAAPDGRGRLGAEAASERIRRLVPRDAVEHGERSGRISSLHQLPSAGQGGLAGRGCGDAGGRWDRNAARRGVLDEALDEALPTEREAHGEGHEGHGATGDERLSGHGRAPSSRQVGRESVAVGLSRQPRRIAQAPRAAVEPVEESVGPIAIPTVAEHLIENLPRSHRILRDRDASFLEPAIEPAARLGDARASRFEAASSLCLRRIHEQHTAEDVGRFAVAPGLEQARRLGEEGAHTIFRGEGQEASRAPSTPHYGKRPGGFQDQRLGPV
jgi:hypothetical protein